MSGSSQAPIQIVRTNTALGEAGRGLQLQAGLPELLTSFRTVLKPHEATERDVRGPGRMLVML